MLFKLQKAAFRDFGEELMKFALSNVASVDTRDTLCKHMMSLDQSQLSKLAVSLNLIPDKQGDEEMSDYEKIYSKDFLMDLLVC